MFLFPVPVRYDASLPDFFMHHSQELQRHMNADHQAERIFMIDEFFAALPGEQGHQLFSIVLWN